MKPSFCKIIVSSLMMLLVLVSGFSIADANHPWSTYHWARTSNPFTLPIGDNTTNTNWQGTLQSVIQDWSLGKGSNVDTDYTDSKACLSGTTTCRPIIVIPRKVTGVAGSNCSAVLGTTQVCNKSYGANGWLGLASIWLSGSHIIAGTAKMNDTYLSASGGRYNTGSERRHVMCQEVAHTFGLGHQSTDGSSQNTCMDYYSNTGLNATSLLSTIPNYHDYDQLSSVYSHPDGTTTVSTTGIAPAQASAQDEDNPRNWGRLLEQSKDGRSSVYEQPLDKGIRIIRHVLWTQETASRCSACDHRFHDHE